MAKYLVSMSRHGGCQLAVTLGRPKAEYFLPLIYVFFWLYQTFAASKILTLQTAYVIDRRRTVYTRTKRGYSRAFISNSIWRRISLRYNVNPYANSIFPARYMFLG